MARVDPDDDSRRRYIVKHYRYDPERRERRHVVVAAFDSRREYKASCRPSQRNSIGDGQPIRASMKASRSPAQWPSLVIENGQQTDGC
jgi:hypothetical protein